MVDKSTFTRQVLVYLEDAEKRTRNADSWYVCKFPDEIQVIQGSIFKCMNDLRRCSSSYDIFLQSMIHDYHSRVGGPIPEHCIVYVSKASKDYINLVLPKNILMNPHLSQPFRNVSNNNNNNNNKDKIKCWSCFEETVEFKGAVCDTCYEERKKSEKTCTRILSKGPCRGEVCGRKPVGKDGLCLRCNRCVIITSSLETILETEDNN